MNWKNFITFILVVCAIICLGKFINEKVEKNIENINENVIENLLYDEEYDIDFDLINIDNDVANVLIKESDTALVKVKIYGKDRKYVDLKTDNNILSIKTKSKSCIFFCSFDISKIEIFLPKDFSKKVVIDSDVGDIEIGNFENSDFDLDIDTGNIKIDSLRNINIDCDFGIIDINSVNGKLTIDNDTGDININNLLIKENSSIKNDVGSIKIGKTNEIKIVVNNDVGNVNINNNYLESNIKLTIENDAGDINIKN